MKFLIALLLTLQAHATTTDCNSLLVPKPIPSLVSQIIRSELDKPVQYKLRMSGDRSSAREDYIYLTKVLPLAGYRVLFELDDFKAYETVANVDFTIKGLGRDVAQAVIELTNPQISRGLSVDGVSWLTPRPPETSPPSTIDGVTDAMRIPVRDFDLPNVVTNYFSTQNIVLVGDLIHYSAKRILEGAGIGPNALSKIKGALAALRLSLATDVRGWPPEDIDIVELELAQNSSPTIILGDWIQRDSRKNLALFLPGYRGVSEQRPIVKMQFERGQRFADLAFINYAYFVKSSAVDLESRLRFIQRQPTPTKIETVRRLEAAQRNAAKLEVLPVTAISETQGVEKLKQIAAEKQPVVVVPPVRDAATPEASFVILPLLQ